MRCIRDWRGRGYNAISHNSVISLLQQFAIMPAIMCRHARKIGDNYGLTCQDCGERIEGYGYGGWFGSNLKGNEQCMHVWVNISDIAEQCIYCFTEQERGKHKTHYEDQKN